MAITISGENNNDRITAQDGVIDTISGFNISGIITASSFTGDLTGDVTGNVTGNINNSTLLLQTGSTERVRITSDGKISTGALASPDGNLHVYSSSAGSVTAASDANELVLESSANVGMSFLTATNSVSRIKFGDSRQTNRGVIAYSHSADSLIFQSVGNERARITSGGDILIGRTTGLTNAKVSIQCDAGESAIAVQLNTNTGTSNLLQAYSSAGPNVASITVNPTATPDLMFNVWDGSSTAEKIRITSNGRLQIGSSILTDYNQFNGPGRLNIQNNNADGTVDFSQGIVFTDNVNNQNTWTHAGIVATGSSGYTGNLVFGTDGGPKSNSASGITEKMRITKDGNVGIGTNNPGKLLEIFGTDPTIKLRDSSGDAYAMIEADSADQGSLRFRADPLDAGSGTHIRFDTDGNERLRIKSDGALSLTSENTTGWLLKAGQDTSSYSAIDGHFPTTNRTLYLNQETTHRSFVVWNKNGSDGYGFGLDSSGNFKVVYSTNERLRITNSGRINVGDADLNQNVDQLSVTVGAQNALDNVARFQSSAAASGTSETLVKIYKGAGYGGVISGYITQGSDHGLKFYTANNGSLSERVRITSAGRVGIGTDTIGSNIRLDVCDGIIRSIGSGSHDTRIEFFRKNTGSMGWIGIPNWNSAGLYIYGPTASSNEIAASYGDGAWNFFTGGNSTRKIRVDSGGRTLFRTNGSQTTPITDNNVPVQIAESTGNMCYFGANLGNSYGALFGYHAAYGGTVIRNVSTSDIVFYTNSTTERLRIDHSANTVTVKNAEFQVNNQELQVTSSNSYASHFNYQDGGSNYISFKNTGSTTFRNNVGGGHVMVVYGSGNIGAPSGNNIYNASDERLKENMVELTNGLDKIKKLKPYSFNWKKGFDKDLEGVTQYGFGAHQAKTVDEKLVEKFSENDIELDGETIKDPLRVNEKHVIPLLVKAIQEQQEQIEILKSEVNALKGS